MVARKHDYDHYLTTLLLPRLARKAVFALRAFNVEVALIGDVASNQNIALMRMQFWKDTLNLVFEVGLRFVADVMFLILFLSLSFTSREIPLSSL